MSRSPISASFPGSNPYTYTAGVDTNTLGSLFSTVSDNMDNSFGTSLSPEESSSLASKSSALASMMRSGSNSASTTASASASTGANISASSGTSTSTQPTTLATSTTPAQSSSPSSSPSAATASLTSAVTSTASTPASSSSAVASSAANNSTSDLHKESSGAMSSPGMQAAVAVPVVLVAMAVFALIFICMRRRRKRNNKAAAAAEVEKSPAANRKKRNWTRHLRVFSFDTELLMGGRYSSTNSIRSRQTGSLRSANRSQHSGSPSVHSVEEVAPPYRDAISAAQPPNIGAVMAGAGAAGAAAGIKRSASSATAPPPYGAAAGRLATPTSPARSQHEDLNPFADTGNSPTSPVEGSPFNDPPGTTPAVSRNSSLYRSDRDDTSSIGGVSDAASIRQAMLARNASVMSGGRVVEVSRSSQ